MATLLMIESWLQSTGIALPQLINARRHEYVLAARDLSIYPDDHPVITHAAGVLETETNDLGALTDRVRRYAERRTVDGVLTTCDYYLAAAATCAQVLGLPGAPPQAMLTATRKHLVRDATRRARLPGPEYAVADTWEATQNAAAEIGYPMVAKPVDLNSGTSVQPIWDEAGLKDAYSDITSATHNTRDQPLSRLILLEGLLDGPEVSVEAVTVYGKTHIAGITAKHVDPSSLVEIGHEFPARLSRNDDHAVRAHVERTLAAIGYTHGVSHTEVKLTAEGPRIVEINPRQAGGYIFDLVEMVTGTSLLGTIIDLALGQSPRFGSPSNPIGPGPHSASAAIAFQFPPVTAGMITQARSVLDVDPSVRRWELKESPLARAPVDNNERAGYVIATEHRGVGALTCARRALDNARAT